MLCQQCGKHTGLRTFLWCAKCAPKGWLKANEARKERRKLKGPKRHEAWAKEMAERKIQQDLRDSSWEI